MKGNNYIQGAHEKLSLFLHLLHSLSTRDLQTRKTISVSTSTAFYPYKRSSNQKNCICFCIYCIFPLQEIFRPEKTVYVFTSTACILSLQEISSKLSTHYCGKSRKSHFINNLCPYLLTPFGRNIPDRRGSMFFIVLIKCFNFSFLKAFLYALESALGPARAAHPT